MNSLQDKMKQIFVDWRGGCLFFDAEFLGRLNRLLGILRITRMGTGRFTGRSIFRAHLA